MIAIAWLSVLFDSSSYTENKLLGETCCWICLNSCSNIFALQYGTDKKKW